MLVDRRDIERGVDLRDYPNMSYRQKRSLLQDLAYWLLKNGYSMAEQHLIEERVAGRLRVMEGVSGQITGSTVCRLFIQRSGILREPVKGQIDFSHRTFQEFLGAQAALDEGDIGLLVKNAHDEQWREVVILAAGLARSNERGLLIEQLITRGDRETKDRHQLHLLAVACLETSIDLEPKIRKEVQKRLRSLVPPKNITEAKALSSAGELALPFLTYDKGKTYYANIAAACVRTLTLIGGDSALYILSPYGSDLRIAVQAELGRGWDYFERWEYANQVFSGRDSLRLRRPSSLEGIQGLTLRSLIVDEGYTEDLKPVSALDDLTILHLYDLPRLRDLSPIRTLNKLRNLAVWFCGLVSDIEPLKDLSSLKELRLDGAASVSDFSPLRRLDSLTSLTLRHCSGLTDLDALSHLKSLEKLDLSYCSKVRTLSPLINLPNLKLLTLKGLKLESEKILEELRSRVIVRP